MRIVVWGLGHIGTVSAACLAQLGHEVIGVEQNAQRRAAIAAGYAPVQEPGLVELLNEAQRVGRLHVVEDGRPYIAEAEVSLICVGTPLSDTPHMSMVEGDLPNAVSKEEVGRENLGTLSLEALRKVAVQIGQGLRDAPGYHVVALRSTVPPGTTCGVLLPLLEQHSERRAGRDFGIGVVPEFLREGSALHDFREPPYTIIGAVDARCGAVLAELFQGVNAPLMQTRVAEAELLKLACNAFHGLKAAFANEMGRLCEHLGVDGDRVMELVRADHKLNISPAYLQPGFAFGGPCLLKDLQALTGIAQQHALPLPVLEGILPSNELHLKSAHRTIVDHALRHQMTHIGLLGLSFKSGTGDLRDSPALQLLRWLQKDGFTLHVYDPELPTDTTETSSFPAQLPPEIVPLLCTTCDEVLQQCSLVIVTQRHPDFEVVLHPATSAHPPKVCLDLTRCSTWNDPASNYNSE